MKIFWNENLTKHENFIKEEIISKNYFLKICLVHRPPRLMRSRSCSEWNANNWMSQQTDAVPGDVCISEIERRLSDKTFRTQDSAGEITNAVVPVSRSRSKIIVYIKIKPEIALFVN